VRFPDVFLRATAVKGRLKTLRERKAFIRVSFGVVRIGLPLFLAVACLLPGTVPRWRVSRDNETVF
jgi:hypothetical protein